TGAWDSIGTVGRRDVMGSGSDGDAGRLRGCVLSAGAVVVGVGDLSGLLVEPGERGLCVVAFGMRYPDREIERLPDDVALQAAIGGLAEGAGRVYSAIERFVSDLDRTARCCRIDEVESVFGRMRAALSQKAVAALAGLGWVGRSSLLVTPGHGPRVRLGTLFTDAALGADAPFAANHCGSCRICQDACPVGAVTGEEASFEGLRGFRIDAGRCRAHVDRNMETLGRREFRGVCLKECPFGRSE
ncbi:MAG: epoxyqueuosine reductase, partial [Phycisphaerae bacterium]|nr:epoxyqueuosine reductase [Phycisphaerae bacterium]